MNSDENTSSNSSVNMASLGEKLLLSYVEKREKASKESIKNFKENRAKSNENKEEIPNFFKMLDIDAAECDENWIRSFHIALHEADENAIKEYSKQTIEMLSSIVYFLIMEKNNKNTPLNEISTSLNEPNFEQFNKFYFMNGLGNVEMLHELTNGLDPEFDLIQSAKIQSTKLENSTNISEKANIYKTSDMI